MREPLLLSTWSFGRIGNDAAWPGLVQGGSAIDAVEKVCCTIEADPDIDSVGFGGLPDRAGQVSLDGCIMECPARCGSAAGVRHHLHVVSIARQIMERTPHIMLVGDAADEFADTCGFARRELLSTRAHARWQELTSEKQDDNGPTGPGAVDRVDGAGRLSDAQRTAAAGDGDDDEARWGGHDTIGTLAIDCRGVLAGACSTSGTPLKHPGRVGDSPIIGHGLYVDPEAGAATATGTGELIMGICGSFLLVELMRRGTEPVDALKIALNRIAASFTLRPEHQVALIALRNDGDWAAGSLRPGYRTSIATKHLHAVLEPAFCLYPDS